MDASTTWSTVESEAGRHVGRATTGRDKRASQSTPARQLVFASILTPSWSLGLLLFACLFLPFSRGCNNDTHYMYEAFNGIGPSAWSIFDVFFSTWPFLFGLTLAVATIITAVVRQPLQCRLLWASLSTLIIVNGLLLSGALYEDAAQKNWLMEWEQRWHEMWLIAPSLGLLVLVLLTKRRCHNGFHAALWLQFFLACLAAVQLPLLVFGHLLIGAKLAVVFSSCLILSTIIQWFDGERALTRSRGESTFQMSLKAMLALMLAGGLTFSWAGSIAFPDAVEATEPGGVTADASPTVQ